MRKYVLKRILISIVILFFVSFIIYGLMRCLPTSPGSKSYEEWLAQLEEMYHMNGGIIPGFFAWLGEMFTGNFGDSWLYTVPVLQKFNDTVWLSFIMGGIAFILEIIIAIPLGVLAATKQYSKTDYAISVFALAGISLPTFFFASLLKLVFSVKLGWFDLYGLIGRNYQQLSAAGQFWDKAHHLVLPIVTRELMKFARARAEFEALGAQVSVMEPDKLEIVNNKAHLLDAMRAHGLRTPEYRRVHTVEKLKAAVSALGYPEKALCVKAAVGNGSRGIRMLNANISRFDLFFEQKPNSMFISYEELIRTLSERETMPEMLVMEYLPGTEYSVDFLADHGEPIYTVSRRGLSVVTSNMMSLVVDDNPAVKEICTQVVRSLELDGNFGFDLLYNANDETPYVIEINPRLTAGVVSCAAAGVNLPYLGMKRLLGEPLPELTPHFGTRMSRRYQEAFFDAAGNRLDW